MEDNLNILKIQEQDRQRIARDLHDSSLQTLTHLVHKLELCGLYIDSDPIKAKMEIFITRNKLKSVIDEIRGTIFDLRPMTFDDLGFRISLIRLLDVVNEEKKFQIDYDIDDIVCENDIVLSTIYRIIHELFCNISKHSEATKIIFTCKLVHNSCIIHISDNGKGFSLNDVIKNQKDENYRHFGLKVLKERVELLKGTINLNSIIGEGTYIDINIPLY